MTSPRPEFEPLTAEEAQRRKSPGVLPWLRLMRLPNVFTAIADVAMGYLFVRGTEIDGTALLLVVATSATLYTAGMVLNDLFDYQIDTVERPFRPLPSGQISLPAARILGFGLLLTGIGLGWGASAWLAAPVPGMMATALAAAVIAYDAWLKQTALGPLGMGLCRFLNVLLGMSGGQGLNFDPAMETGQLLVAAGIGIYIVGVTWFARSEAQTSQPWQLVAAMGVMTLGVVALAASGRYAPLHIELRMFWLLLALLMFSVLRRCAAAAIDPGPKKVQLAVKHSILSLIWLDAAIAIAVSSPLAGIAIAALLIPALLLGRWVYST